jgi:hypothetical protein
MQRSIFILILIFLFNSALPAVLVAKTNIIWKDRFTRSEKEKLTIWLRDVSSAVSETLGDFPFDVNLYIHRSENKNEPVPWAHTIRSEEEGVHFYVNTDFTLEVFQKDWTAPHEIAHLSIPYLGKKNMWFSEGYASYMQYQVMRQGGVMTTNEVIEKYASKLYSIKSTYDSDADFLAVSKQLKNRYNYPAVYWGGACYFYQADSILRLEKNMSLTDVIVQYQERGRESDQSLEELISSLNEISESYVFSDLLHLFQNGSAKEAVLNTPIPGKK